MLIKINYALQLCFLLILLSCGTRGGTSVTEGEAYPEFVEGESEIPPEYAEAETVSARYTLTLLATGDNLFHETIINSSRIMSGDDGDVFNFSAIYSEVKDLVLRADIAFINQETVMAQAEYSGYPTFNTPEILAQTLVITGFDIINHANNHAMDMEEEGLLTTLRLWEKYGAATVIGARSSPAQKTLVTKNNITLGFLSYTYGLNGNRLPGDKPWLVSLINRQTMAREIDELRPLCDFLAVSMHWGEEYYTQPDSYQRDLAKFLAAHNVDLVIGHHPHVLQPFESLPRPDGKKTLCFYSLGNFVSHQYEKNRVFGAMLFVTFVKENGETYITEEGLVPVVCHFDSGFSNTKAYPLYSYSRELLNRHAIRGRDNTFTLDYINSYLGRLNTRIYTQSPFE
jgi:poly-gamma-glutamate synthesis protein (capsule biosynthesis protein)